MSDLTPGEMAEELETWLVNLQMRLEGGQAVTPSQLRVLEKMYRALEEY